LPWMTLRMGGWFVPGPRQARASNEDETSHNQSRRPIAATGVCVHARNYLCLICPPQGK